MGANLAVRSVLHEAHGGLLRLTPDVNASLRATQFTSSSRNMSCRAINRCVSLAMFLKACVYFYMSSDVVNYL